MRGGARPGAGRKPGTPNKVKKPDAKGKTLHIRLSDLEYDEVARCAANIHDTVSDYVRGAIRSRCRLHETV